MKDNLIFEKQADGNFKVDLKETAELETSGMAILDKIPKLEFAGVPVGDAAKAMVAAGVSDAVGVLALRFLRPALRATVILTWRSRSARFYSLTTNRLKTSWAQPPSTARPLSSPMKPSRACLTFAPQRTICFPKSPARLAEPRPRPQPQPAQVPAT